MTNSDRSETDLVEFLGAFPFREDELDFERSGDPGRDIETCAVSGPPDMIGETFTMTSDLLSDLDQGTHLNETIYSTGIASSHQGLAKWLAGIDTDEAG